MPTARPTTINPFRVLRRHRNFRIFWAGQTLSLIGTWMQSMAQGWLALELSDSAFVVGLVTAVGSLPILLFSLYGGVLVDRYDKLKLVTWAQALLLLEAAVLWWLTWTGNITIAWLLVLATVNGGLAAVEIPARQALMVDLVGRGDLHEAIALNASGFNLARIVGPGLAALVIASLGIAWCFAVNALSYLAVLVGLLSIRLPPFRPARNVPRPLEGIRELFAYMRGTPAISMLMRMVVVYSILGIPYLTLMPVVARDVLRTEAGGYGVLLACVGVGGLAGALVLAAIARRVRRGALLILSSYVFPATLLVFALARATWVAAAVLLVAGFAMIINNALANGLLQEIVPNAMRGRLMAAYSLVVVGLSQVVGAFLAGAVARAFGAAWAIGGAAAVMLGYALLVFGRREEVRAL